MGDPVPILVVELFPVLDRQLVALLGTLNPGDWDRPTVCVGWSVKDVAGHLLDTATRRLSSGRDRHVPPGPPPDLDTHAKVGAFVNAANRAGVEFYRGVSARHLVDLMEATTARLHEYFRGLDPHADANFPVSWAGESRSPVWFDVARELTERWHHQQQIRDAVGAEPITTREFLHPVLDTFMRALPHASRHIPAPDGTLWNVEVTGPAADAWLLHRETGAWRLRADVGQAPDATASLAGDDAWRLFTKGFDRSGRKPAVLIEGDPAIDDVIRAMRCIVG